MANRISRACDACRVRKVRCSGAQPCSQCAHLDLECVFPSSPVKRKPPVRGRLVAQLKEKGKREHDLIQSSNNSTVSSPTSPDSWTTSFGPPVTSISGIIRSHPAEQSQGLSGATGVLDLTPSEPYTADFFLKLLPEFEEAVYPMNPVITPAEMLNAVNNMHKNYENAALVFAFGAVTINLTRTSWHLQGDVATQMKELLQKAWSAHRLVDVDYLRHGASGIFESMYISVKRIVTCLFMEISLMAFKSHDRAFAILREAISMIELLKIGKHTLHDQELPAYEVSRRQRLYWEAYIHERFLSMVTGFRTALEPLSSGYPFPDNMIPANIDLGWTRLIKLFNTMDQDFLAYRREPDDAGISIAPMQASWIESKQAELDSDEHASLQDEQALIASGKGGLTEFQHADLFVTRLWMRTLVWELALQRNLLSTALRANAHEGLSVHYPTLRLSSQLRTLVSRLGSVASIGTHGSGILQKLFDITTTIANVLNLPFAEDQTQEDFRIQMEDFFFLVQFLFQFERIDRSQRNYLRLELEKLQERYFAVVDFAVLAATSPDE